MKHASPATPVVHDAIEVLQDLVGLFGRRREQIARQVGLTTEQWRVLEQIESTGFMPSMFAREKACSPAAVSKLLRQIQDKGLITVAISPSNGRQRTYTLTAAGRRVVDRLAALREDAINQVWRPMGEDRLESFVSFGKDLAGRLDEYSRKQEE